MLNGIPLALYAFERLIFSILLFRSPQQATCPTALAAWLPKSTSVSASVYFRADCIFVCCTSENILKRFIKWNVERRVVVCATRALWRTKVGSKGVALFHSSSLVFFWLNERKFKMFQTWQKKQRPHRASGKRRRHRSRLRPAPWSRTPTMTTTTWARATTRDAVVQQYGEPLEDVALNPKYDYDQL